ncbi:MAG: MFS transporter [Actinomycetia bacterium]|nr:MFS transporter [Actinomycetes bacterium]MCP5035569.1 MFS transporter [Actinomycetes bacterium]
MTRRLPKPPPRPTTDLPRALIWSYSLLAACMAAGYGVLFTVVGDYRERYGISEGAIGWIIGIGFIAGFASQILIAPIGDRGRAKAVVLIAVIVNAIGLMMMGFGDDVTTIMAGRIVAGLATGAAQPSIRRIVVVGAPDDLGRNLGRLMSAGVFGFAFGPAISAVLVGPFGLGAPFLVMAGASLVAVAIAFSVPIQESTEPSQRGLLAFDLLRIRPLVGAIVLGAAVYFMIGTFDALWDVVHVDLGTSTWLANLGITLFALPLVILAPIGGKLAQDTGPFRLAAIGLLIAAAFMISYGYLPSGSWIFAVVMFQAATDGFTLPAAGIGVAMTAPAERQAGAQGLLGAAQALAAGMAAVAAGTLYEAYGRALTYTMAGLAMVVLVVVGMGLAFSAWRPAATPGHARGSQADERVQ